MNELTNVGSTKMTGPYDNSIVIHNSNNLIWATVEQWCLLLRAPYFFPAELSRTASLQAALLKGGPFSATVGGNVAYRWPPIAAALDLWHRNWMVAVSQNKHTAMPTNLRAESEAFAKGISKLKAWGYELQERELQAALNIQTKQSPASNARSMDVSQAMKAIESLAQATQVVLLHHEAEIHLNKIQIEEMRRDLPILRPPDEFISIKQRCFEQALSPETIVKGRMNLSQACGQYMNKMNMLKGRKIQERLDGSAMVSDVGTWRRSDIDSAIATLMNDMNKEI
jgi:hypothetical protein